MVNGSSGSISHYSIARNGTLALVGSTLVSNQSGVGAFDARLSTDGQTVYVNESRVATIGEFTVDGSALTELGSIPLPTGATPAGVAVKEPRLTDRRFHTARAGSAPPGTGAAVGRDLS